MLVMTLKATNAKASHTLIRQVIDANFRLDYLQLISSAPGVDTGYL